MLISRHLSALATLTFIGVTGMAGVSVAAGPSSQFDVNGDVGTPGVYDFSSLSALPATSESATYAAGKARSRTPIPGRRFGRSWGRPGGSSRSRE
jgi:hypothetical protein